MSNSSNEWKACPKIVFVEKNEWKIRQTGDIDFTLTLCCAVKKNQFYSTVVAPPYI